MRDSAAQPVHEFRLSELPDRQRIAFRGGLATVLQIDGLGSVAVKLAAYHQVMQGAQGFFPGFKVFLQRSNDPVSQSPKAVRKLRPGRRTSAISDRLGRPTCPLFTLGGEDS